MGQSLVTGGHGFIASHLCRALVERGDEVTVIDKAVPAPGRSGLALQGVADEIELVTADLAEAGVAASLVANHGPFESVFHLAAQTLVGPAMRDPVATFEANVTATWQLLEACRTAEVSALVVASSDKAYGPSPDLPYREGQRLAPAAPYEASKAACEMVAQAYAFSYGLPLAITRFANVYGPGDLNESRLVPELIGAAVAGRRPQIRSDGSPERDYLFVDDAVAAYLAIEAIAGGSGAGNATSKGPASAAEGNVAFNAGSGRSHSVREVVDALARATGRAIEADYLGAGVPDGEIDRQWVDARRLTAATGWQPRTGLERGLGLAYSWYAERPELLPAPSAS